MNVIQVDTNSAKSVRLDDSQPLQMNQTNFVENIETKSFEKDTPQSADHEMSSDNSVSIMVGLLVI